MQLYDQLYAKFKKDSPNVNTSWPLMFCYFSAKTYNISSKDRKFCKKYTKNNKSKYQSRIYVHFENMWISFVCEVISRNEEIFMLKNISHFFELAKIVQNGMVTNFTNSNTISMAEKYVDFYDYILNNEYIEQKLIFEETIEIANLSLHEKERNNLNLKLKLISNNTNHNKIKKI